MKNRKVICVDFGSAYTKVAVRKALASPTRLIHDIPLAAREAGFCVPSVVARAERGGKTRWLVGEKAADVVPSAGVKVFRHWKSMLFSDSASSSDVDEVREAAVHFFKQLRASLTELNLGVDLDRCPARVCVPKLADGELGEARVIEAMRAAGWQLADDRPTIPEPASNAIGVFSRGRNATHVPRWSRDTHPYLLGMLDREGLLAAVRSYRDEYGVLVVDIGAFTTDFGYVRFSTDFEKPPTIHQQSLPIGVQQLDEAALAALPEDFAEAVRYTRATEWEKLKQQLYRGVQVAVQKQNGGRVIIDDNENITKVANVIEDFAARVIRAEGEFRRDGECGAVHAYVLTGGGSLIGRVREAILRPLRLVEGTRIFDLLDEQEPRRQTPKKRDAMDRFREDEDKIAALIRENRELTRGGSAIGGASVLFECTTDAIV